MGTFNVDVKFINSADRDRTVTVRDMMVDTGADATWVPRDVLEQLGVPKEKTRRRYTMANSEAVERDVAYAIIQLGDVLQTIDEVIFAEEGDQRLLGARALEGLGVRVDPDAKQLVAAAPGSAAGHRRVATDTEAGEVVPASSTATSPNPTIPTTDH